MTIRDDHPPRAPGRIRPRPEPSPIGVPVPEEIRELVAGQLIDALAEARRLRAWLAWIEHNSREYGIRRIAEQAIDGRPAPNSVTSSVPVE